MGTNVTSVLHVDGDVIEFSGEYQGVTLWLGDGIPVHVSDDLLDVDLLDLVQSPLQRAVTVARLSRIVEVLSDAT